MDKNITTPTDTETEQEEKGIRVDPTFYTMLSNQHLNSKDWAGFSALAVLLYWWLCDKVTEAYDEDGVSIGVVMFGRPIGFSTIANDKNLNTSWRAVQRNMQHLDDRGFIRRKRYLTTQGYIYEVVGCAREVLPEGAVKGKNGKLYFKATPEEQAAKIKGQKDKGHKPDQALCDFCKKPLNACDCLELVNEDEILAEAEKQTEKPVNFTCPICHLTSYLTQAVADKHMATCKAAPAKVAPPVVITPTPAKIVTPAPTYPCSSCGKQHPTEQERTDCGLAFEKKKIVEEEERKKDAAERAEMYQEIRRHREEYERKEEEKAAEYARQMALLEKEQNQPSKEKSWSEGDDPYPTESMERQPVAKATGFMLEGDDDELDESPTTSFMLEGEDDELDKRNTTSFNLEGEDDELA
jgi:hypothetical protein